MTEQQAGRTSQPDEIYRNFRNLQLRLQRLEHRESFLWWAGVVVMLLLTTAVVSFSLPGLIRDPNPAFQFQLGQAVRALIGLVLIFNTYTIYQQVLIKRLRRQLTEQMTETPVREAVRADHVEIKQGGANSVEAHTVSITQGGAGQVRADEVSVSQGGVGIARAGKLSLAAGASAFAVLADDATVDGGANVFMLLARSTSGDVRPLIDVRSALAIGAGFGLAVSLLRRLR